ncbi:MAG: hypothetical protein U0Q15_02395 [Kineosporiaceae bacterium]
MSAPPPPGPPPGPPGPPPATPSGPQGQGPAGTPPPRFDVASLIGGLVLGVGLAFGSAVAGVAAAATISEALGLEQAVPITAFVACMLLPLVGAGVLAFRGRSPVVRGLALGVLISDSIVAIVGGGICISLLSNL